jgi:hypothetical protein
MKTSKSKRDKAVPMDINAGIVQSRTLAQEAKHKKLQRKGYCFKCHKQGYIKKHCPDWQKKKDLPFPYPQKAYTLNLSKPGSSTPKQEYTNLKELACSIVSLDKQGKNQLFNLLLKGDKDF